MSTPKIVHGTFVIERTYRFPPERVFAAFSDPRSKRRWFAEGEGWTVLSYTLDFRVGGREDSTFRFGDGPEIRNETVFQDIVEDRRIVFAYTMAAEGVRFSASLSTLELEPVDGGTRLVFTEHDAFLDGKDGTASREAGSRELLEKLDEELRRPS